MVGSTKINEGLDASVANVGKTEKGVPVIVQKMALDSDQVNFGGGAGNALHKKSSAGDTSVEIDCEGKHLICLKTELSATNVTAVLRLMTKDFNATPLWSISPKVPVFNSGENADVRESGYYHGEGPIYFEVLGMKAFKVILVADPSNGGDISVWASAI